MYSDESIFDTSKRVSVWVTRLPHKRYHDHCLQYTIHRARASVHVWGAISFDWKSALVFLVGTGKKGAAVKHYQEQVLERIIAPAFMGLQDYDASLEAEYVKDQAPIHGTHRALVEVLAKMGIPLHHRQGASPDLNSIENLWHLMKQRIKAPDRFPGTLQAMRQAVEKEWEKLEPRDWNQFIDSMPA